MGQRPSKARLRPGSVPEQRLEVFFPAGQRGSQWSTTGPRITEIHGEPVRRATLAMRRVAPPPPPAQPAPPQQPRPFAAALSVTRSCAGLRAVPIASHLSLQVSVACESALIKQRHRRRAEIRLV